MSNRISDPSVLSRGFAWVLLTYEDGSEFCFQTTLNEEWLRDNGITLEEGCLVRVDKKYLLHGKKVYRQFPYTRAKMSLWDSMTYFDEESAKLKDFL